MAEINPKAYLLLIARLVLSGVFLLAALPKIQDPLAFAASVEGFRVVGGELSAWVALLLPWLELVTGIGLLIPQVRRGSAASLIVLLILFIALHSSAWIRGLDISCGCFGETEAETLPNYLWLILRNSALLIAAICVLCRDWKAASPNKLTEDHTLT